MSDATEVAQWLGETCLDSDIILLEHGHALTRAGELLAQVGIDTQGNIVAIRVQAADGEEAVSDEHLWVIATFDATGRAEATVELVLASGRRIDLDAIFQRKEVDGLESVTVRIFTNEDGVTVSGVDQPFNIWGADEDEDSGDIEIPDGDPEHAGEADAVDA